MADKLTLPQFANEAEEADWWYEHRDLVSAEFSRAAEAGELRRGTLAQRAGLTPTTLRLETADVEKAKNIAQKQGIGYVDYLSMLVHQALGKEPAA